MGSGSEDKKQTVRTELSKKESKKHHEDELPGLRT